MNNLKHATEIDAESLDDIFSYHPWSEAQKAKGQIVRDVLAQAFAMIIKHVPPCPDRTAALRKIREARMDANSAITHDGQY